MEKVILREKEKVIKANAVQNESGLSQVHMPFMRYDVDIAHLDAIHAAQGDGNSC